jgi:signal transduction histidine kinase/ligand-binding sensor domain-containing protein
MGQWLARLVLAVVLQAGMLAWPAWGAPLTPATAPPPTIFSLTEPYFETVGNNDVIPEGAVMALAQDARGLIWIGTQKGLVQYDGYRFRKFVHSSRDPASLAGDYVWCLWSAKDGRIWAGSASDGVSVFDPATEQFTRFRHDPKQPASIGEGIVWALSGDASGGIWIGTDQGLDYLPAGASTVQHYRHVEGKANSLADNRIRSLLHDRSGRLWVGSASGVQRMRADGKGFEALLASGQEVFALFEANDGKLWLGTRLHGAGWLDPAQPGLHWLRTDDEPADSAVNGAVGHQSAHKADKAHKAETRSTNKPDMTQSWVTSIRQVQADRIWITTRGGGVLIAAADGKIVRRLHHDASVASSLPIDEVMTLLIDQSGLLWIGTNGGGLIRHNSKNQAIELMHHSPKQARGLSAGSIQSILELPTRQILLGSTDNGIDVLDRQGTLAAGYRSGGDKVNSAQGLPKSSVRSLFAEPDGTIWAGTQNAGAWQLSPGSTAWREYGLKQGLPDVWAERVMMDKDGVLWVGTPGGIVLRPPGQTTFSAVQSSDGSAMRSFVTSLAQDAKGRLWIGSASGLWLVESQSGGAGAGSKTVRRIAHDPDNPASLISDTVLGLLVGSGDQLWLMTTRGLERMRAWDGQQAQFEHVADRVGEANMVIGENPLQDQLGRIWCAEFMYDPAKKRLIALSRADGFDIGTSHLGAYARLRDGRFLFGGTQGVAVIQPEQFQPWDFQPAIVVTALKINGKAVPPGSLAGKAGSLQALEILPGQRNFSIEFAALEYAEPAKNRYRYRLQGYDKDWIEADSDHRSASYGNLWPGQYTLQVHASNRLGDFSPHELTVRIRVLPAFWQSGWFLLLALLLLSGSVLGGLRWRLAKVRDQAAAKAAVLQTLVDERTAEIAAAHAELASSHSELANAHTELASAHQHLQATQSQLIQSEKMASLGQLVANVAHELNTPLGAVKASGGNIVDALACTLADLPRLFTMLAAPEAQLFRHMIDNAQASTEVLSSREERNLNRQLAEQLQKENIPEARQKAAILLQLRAQRILPQLMPLLRHAEADFILQCANHVASLINNTGNINLAVARVAKTVFALKTFSADANQAANPDVMTRADLRAGLETALATAQTQFRQGIELVCQYDEIGNVLCMSEELVQVWSNLIQNALQAMNNQGTLSVSLRRVENEVQISVVDSGCGIPDDILPRIFDAFFTTRSAGEGSGLGLYIVKKIIDQHRGRIEVHSTVGVGSTFLVALPYATQGA